MSGGRESLWKFRPLPARDADSCSRCGGAGNCDIAGGRCPLCHGSGLKLKIARDPLDCLFAGGHVVNPENTGCEACGQSWGSV